MKDNNLPNVRWHDLRSTFCTLLLRNDFNPKAVSKLMGHSKEIITMDVYGDNRGIIADNIPEIEEFIQEILPYKQAKMTNDQSDVMLDIDRFIQ